MRAFTRETPAEAEVDLREEVVEVESRPSGRRMNEAEVEPAGVFTNRVFEFSEMREEPVITKEAFVREELIIRKRVDQRTETIRDTVRHTEVEVEDLAGADAAAGEVRTGSLAEKVKHVAQDVKQAAGESARREGIDPASMKEKARDVAERATDAAREEAQRQKALDAIRAIDPSLVASGAGDTIRVAYSEQDLVRKKKEVIDQSIEILRRRVDELEMMLAELATRLPRPEAPKKRSHRPQKPDAPEEDEGA